MTTYLTPLPNGADNSALINTAIRQAVAGGNGPSIILEEGVFAIDAPVLINRAVSLRGSGAGITTLAMGQGGALIAEPDGDGTVTCVTLANFDILAKNREKRNTTAIKTANLHSSTISDITIRDHAQGIELSHASNVAIEHISILEMTSHSTGIRINGGHDHTLKDISIDQSGGEVAGNVGVDIASSTATSLSQVRAINCDYGIRLHPAREGEPTNQKVDWCSLSQVTAHHCKIAGFYFNVGFSGGHNSVARLLGVSLVNCQAKSNKVGVIIEKFDSHAIMDGLDIVATKMLGNEDEGIMIGPSYSLNTSDHAIRNIRIADCKVAGNSHERLGAKPGISVGNGTKNIQIVNCTIGSWGEFAVTQSYGVHLQNSPSNGTCGIIISGNMLEGSTGAAIRDQAQSVAKVIHGNVGFITEFAGKFYIPNEASELVVNHFCDGLPVNISITPLDNLHRYDAPIITAITPTTFKVLLSAPAFGNKFFMFKAQVYQ